MGRYAEKVIISLRTKGGRCQGPSNGEHGRRDGARLAVAVIRRKVGRANAVRGGRIDGARAGGDGKVGALCIGNLQANEREQGPFEPHVTEEAMVPNRGAPRLRSVTGCAIY